ncbi:MAG TPA: HAMP domain-containing sensor histidine kinase [Phycisphaerae bacterium]|nr:HAMP domain-containing sensor histidine kinase [Phycisphaerae bacterium]
MKLTARLMYMLLGVIIIGVAINAYLRVQREIRFFDLDMERDELALGHGLRSAVSGVWASAGQQAAMELITAANQGRHIARSRWVWLDSRAEDPYRPRVSHAELEPLARGESISVKKEHGEFSGYRYTYVPVPVEPSRLGAIEISEPLSQIDEYTRETIIRTVITTGLMTVYIACLMGVFGVWLVGRPLHLLIEKAKRVGSGDLSGPLHIPGRNELSELAATMNAMCQSLIAAQERIAAETAARIETLEQLRHADRLKTVGRLASGVAHELGTPLNVVSGRAGLVESGGLSEAETVENARIIRTQAERMTTLIRQLMDFARRRPPEKTAVDLRQVTRQTLELLETLARKRNTILSLTGDDTPMIVKADAGQIDQALANIVMNALQSMPRGGRIEVNLRRERARPPEGEPGSEGQYVCLSVQDEGVGIPEDNLPHIFEPFFTTKEVGQGTGLGLSITYGIIHEHGGWISVSSEVGKGSRFLIHLPQGAD